MAALERQMSSSLISLLLLSTSLLVMAASLAREKIEESEVAVLREQWSSASHLLSRLRAWIIKVSISACAGVDLDFLLMKEVSISLFFWIISGTLFAISDEILFLALSKWVPGVCFEFWVIL